MRVGSLFSGYLGLDQAVESFFGAHTVWTSDIDPGACKIIAHRFDGPNHGDITTIDWATVEPVDILTGGFPCQDLSHAGKRLGLKPGTRSGLWSHMAYAISQLRPRYVIAENVRGLLSASAHSDLEPCPWCVGGSGDGEPPLRALGCVLGDLAELGYDTRAIGLRAADVGAPHGRFRVFVIASDTQRLGRDWRAHEPQRGSVARTAAAWGGEGVGSPADASSQRHGRGQDGRSMGRVDGTPEGEARQRERARGVTGDRSAAAATDAIQQGPQGSEPAGRRDVPYRGTVADPTGDGRNEGRAEPARLVGGSHAAVSGHAAPDADSDGQQGVGRLEPVRRDPDRRSGAHVAWGDYEPAIRRWEAVLQRPAPAPTETGPKGGQRLSPRFVEFMMGLSPGWVTDVPDLSRNAQLKALGNGVVPTQAYEALRRAFAMEEAA